MGALRYRHDLVDGQGLCKQHLGDQQQPGHAQTTCRSSEAGQGFESVVNHGSAIPLGKLIIRITNKFY